MIDKLLRKSLLASALVAGLAAPVHAGYVVSTRASAGPDAGSVQLVDASYNFTNQLGELAGANFLNLSSLSSGSSGSYSGSVDPIGSTGLLTSVYDQASWDSGVPYHETNTASAKASLASGTVGGTSTTAGSNIAAVTTSYWSDATHHTIAGANSGTVTSIPFNFSLDGGASILPQGVPFVYIDWIVGIGTARVESVMFSSGSYVLTVEPPTATGFGTAPLFSSSSSGASFSGVFTITGATVDVPVAEYLQVSAGGGNGPFSQVSADFGDTGTFQWTLPSNDTVTSDSGVFLAAQAPEPGTLFAAILGFGLCLLSGRRKVSAVARRRLF